MKYKCIIASEKISADLVKYMLSNVHLSLQHGKYNLCPPPHVYNALQIALNRLGKLIDRLKII